MSAGTGDTPSPAKLRVREFHLVNYLETPADVAAYLAIVADEDGDDPDQLTTALGHVLRSRGGNRLALKAFVEILQAGGLGVRIEPACGLAEQRLVRLPSSDLDHWSTPSDQRGRSPRR